MTENLEVGVRARDGRGQQRREGLPGLELLGRERGREIAIGLIDIGVAVVQGDRAVEVSPAGGLGLRRHRRPHPVDHPRPLRPVEAERRVGPGVGHDLGTPKRRSYAAIAANSAALSAGGASLGRTIPENLP